MMFIHGFILLAMPVWGNPVNLYVSPYGKGNKFTEAAPGSLLAAKAAFDLNETAFRQQ